MISFKLSEEQEAIRSMLHSFASKTLAPQAREIDEAATLPQDVLTAGWELGLIGATIPVEYGGGGVERSAVTSAIVCEALASGDATQASAILTPTLFVNPLLDHGTSDQKREYLPMFTGSAVHIASMALLEEQFTFAMGRMKTLAERRGNGWRISGRKRMVPLAERASHFMVLARRAEDGVDGIEAFIVPRDAKGLTIQPEPGQMGLKALPSARLDLDMVELPGSARLGGDEGIDARRLVASLRLATGAMAVGLCRAVTDTSVAYAKQRVAFGQPIGQKQAIAFMIADMHCECDAMRWMTWKAASDFDRRQPEAIKSTALAQDYIRRHALKIADDGVQVFGGHGFIRDLPLEMWLRNTRALTVLEGVAAA